MSASSRTKRVYAAPGEASVPYLRPYDVFDYLPQPADLLSKSGTPGLESLIPKPGVILQTCSGRNLGPLAYADEYLARFAVSDDMLRVKIDDESDRLYVLTFLMTGTGQALVAQNKTGAVIDHLAPQDLAAVDVPIAPSDVYRACVSEMRVAVMTRQDARLRLADAIREYEALHPIPDRGFPLKRGWAVQAANLGGRLDAARYDPALDVARGSLLASGGVVLGEVAEANMPPRYHRFYVEQPYGRPVLSGRQLLQAQPINLRYIAGRSFDFEDYELKDHTIAFAGEGRAEERLGFPSFITSDRADWLASEHVMRVTPKPGVHAGWLYLAFASRAVLAQVKAIACGSVIDELSPTDVLTVAIPRSDIQLADRALACWDDFAEARRHELGAISSLTAWIAATADATPPDSHEITAA